MKGECVLAMFLLLAGTVALGEITLDFDGVPDEIKGAPESKRELTVFASLTCGENEVDGAWTLSMTVGSDPDVGAKIIDVSVDGLTVLTDIGEIPIYERAHFQFHEPTLGRDNDVVHADDPNRYGAISTVSQLNYPASPVVLLPDVVHRLARLTVEVTMPPAGETRDITFRYEDGFKGSGQPVRNYISYHGSGATFSTAERTVRLAEGKADFRRGDPNEDGTLDMSDAIFSFNYLFTGGAEPKCKASVDANDDGRTDISDPIYLLLYLFYGGDRPKDPFETCGPDPTDDGLTCAEFTTCP